MIVQNKLHCQLLGKKIWFGAKQEVESNLQEGPLGSRDRLPGAVLPLTNHSLRLGAPRFLKLAVAREEGRGGRRAALIHAARGSPSVRLCVRTS